MKMKKVFALVFSFALMLSVVIPSTADAAKSPWNFNITQDERDENFTVPNGHGHLKLWFHNRGQGSVTINVYHESGKAYVKDMQVPAGKTFTFRSTEYPGFKDGVRAGRYFIQLQSSAHAVNVAHAGFASNVSGDVSAP